MPDIMGSLYAKLAIAAVVVGLGFGAGWKWRDGDLQKLRADVATEAQAQSQLLTEEAERRIAAEHSLNTKSDELATANEKVSRYAKTQVDGTRTDIRNGSLQLSVPTKNCSITVAANPGAASVPAGETRAELLPEFAERLIARAAQCDAEVRERNELMDRYNIAREEYERLSALH